MMIKTFLKNLIKAKSYDKEVARKELILNILLAASIVGFTFLNIIRAVDVISNPNDRGLPIIFTLLILIFFIFLFWLSKKGKVTISSLLLVLIYALPTFYSFISWGADLPAALLLAVLLVTMSGSLIGARFAFISTLIIAIFLLTLTYLQENNIITVNSYWRQESHTLGDAIAYTFLFLIIATVAWLFAREIKKALRRAQISEQALKEERDSLEIKVIERTKQIKQMKAEKINQLYRLAEFGRLSSGIFHDLINPLTAVSLNLEQITVDNKNQISSAKSCLGQALIATHKMEDLIASIRKQLQRKNDLKNFSLNEEVEQAIQILSYKARRANVQIGFKADQSFFLHGDAIKFSQIITNLVSNAIEAYDQEDVGQKKVDISLDKKENEIQLTVSDNGCGIHQRDVDKIFEPFFSTKQQADGGLGIGLSSTKNLIEKDFGGTIKVVADSNTTFIIIFPTHNV